MDSREPVAVIGWGSCGCTVGERFLESGVRVRACYEGLLGSSMPVPSEQRREPR